MANVELEEQFGFLLKENSYKNEISNQIKNLHSVYENGLNLGPENFVEEFFQFCSLILKNPPNNLNSLKICKYHMRFKIWKRV